MDVFLKATGAVLITVILYLTISKQNKEISSLVAITGCCAVMLAASSYLRPIIEFIKKLKLVIGFDNELINVLLKAVGIGIIAEITTLICTDSGNASLGKTLQILASAVILCISLPIFDQLLELLQQILGAI